MLGGKIKKKKNPYEKNKKIRKVCQPKNAVCCLNELKPGLDYLTEQESKTGKPCVVSVEVMFKFFKLIIKWFV